MSYKDNIVGKVIPRFKHPIMKVFIIILTMNLYAVENGYSMDNEIVTIKVLDAKFKTINDISDSLEIKALNKFWHNKFIFTKNKEIDFKFKLDISFNSKKQRWLYDPLGFVRLLTKSRSVIYEINNPPNFAKVILKNHLVDICVAFKKDTVEDKITPSYKTAEDSDGILITKQILFLLMNFKEDIIDIKDKIDSSRGKKYFYKTGQKVTITVLNANKEKLLEALNNSELIYEAYEKNELIEKD
jgi:hypothetical protein